MPTIQATTKNEVIFKWKIPETFTGNKNELVAIIRHSQLTDGTAIWPETTFLREVQANTDHVVLPLMNGTYMVKFKNTNNKKSINAGTAIVDLPDDLPYVNPVDRKVDESFYKDDVVNRWKIKLDKEFKMFNYE